MLVFSIDFVNYFSSNLLSGYSFPPLPCVRHPVVFVSGEHDSLESFTTWKWKRYPRNFHSAWAKISSSKAKDKN